jgi:transcriptional regulator with XRE-family HTH domain
MPREGRKTPSSHALALLYLRSRRDWSQKELADRLGWADEKQVSRFERGARPLTRKTLDTAAEALGYPPEAVELLLAVNALIGLADREEEEEEPPLPEPLSSELRRLIDRSSLTAAWSFLDGWRTELIRALTSVKVETSRRKAQELWERLKSSTRQERREAIALPEFQSWALAELVCHESEKAAAHKVEMALELADLALYIAGRIPGEERWRSQVEGYCWAYLANARRVANDFAGADAAFARAWKLWKAGAAVVPGILAEWRLFDLESSLRREQHRFSEALDSLNKAMSSSGSNPATAARILLKKEHVLAQIGDTERALATLMEATPYVEASGDSRLLFALFFNMADTLCCLGRYEEAADRLSRIRDLAVQQGKDLDLIRVVWLEAKVAAGQGKRDEARVRLEQVRQDFTVRELPYDAALASLELAVLYLEEKRTAEVQSLARTMGWIFQAQGIAREALATLNLFLDAAQRETLTVELTRRVAAELKRTKASAPLQNNQRGRG